MRGSRQALDARLRGPDEDVTGRWMPACAGLPSAKTPDHCRVQRAETGTAVIQCAGGGLFWKARARYRKSMMFPS